MKLVTPLLDDWCYLARALGEDERAEFAAVAGFAYDPEVAARTWANTAGGTWCLLGDDDLPVLAGGLEPLRTGVLRAWMVTTPTAWTQHGTAITRHARRLLRRVLTQAHRIETCTLHRRTKACQWYLKALHMRFEGLHHRAAADGQDLVTYAITRSVP